MGGPGSGGFNKKPTALHVVQGTARPGRVSPHEPQPRPIAPPMPRGLDPTAQRAWRRFAPVLERLGLLTVTDGQAFTELCRAWARLEDAEAEYQQTKAAIARRRSKGKDLSLEKRAEMMSMMRTAQIGESARAMRSVCWRMTLV